MSSVIERKKNAAANQKIDSGIDSQLKVFSKQPSEWVAVQEFLANETTPSPTRTQEFSTR